MKQRMSEAEALVRLLKIEWKNKAAYENSNLLLMKEYFRRMRGWYLKLKPEILSKTEWWGFFDVAREIDASVRAKPETIREFRNNVQLGAVASKVCERYLHWVALANVIEHEEIRRIDPFEPAIRVLETGCEFTYRHGYMEVCAGSFQIINSDLYNTSEPFIVI